MRLGLYVVLAIQSVWPDYARGDQERPVPVSDEPTETDYQVAEEFFVSKQDIQETRRRVTKTFKAKNTEKEIANVMYLEAEYSKKVDQSIGHLIKQAAKVLRAKKYYQEADEIESEYTAFYSRAVANMYAGINTKDMGDHPPLSQWLANVHIKIEDLIGEYFCKQFHLHDIYIFNHAIPVVFAPKSYDLKEYKLHAAGYLYTIGKWKHHGLAGVTTYWAVNALCQLGTGGIGVITFVCGPIAGYSEHVMDKKIAPPIASKIWTNANN